MTFYKILSKLGIDRNFINLIKTICKIWQMSYLIVKYWKLFPYSENKTNNMPALFPVQHWTGSLSWCYKRGERNKRVWIIMCTLETNIMLFVDYTLISINQSITYYRQIALQLCPALITGTCEYVTLHGKGKRLCRYN